MTTTINPNDWVEFTYGWPLAFKVSVLRSEVQAVSDSEPEHPGSWLLLRDGRNIEVNEQRTQVVKRLTNAKRKVEVPDAAGKKP